MGPTIIFDKSFLQSLSVDESVFFEQFFLSNITLLFYVETLGDLDLVQHKSGKPITKVISELATKTPLNGAAPNVHHSRLVLGSLVGIDVEMDGRIIRDGGVEKIDPDGNVGIFYDESPEELALKRWHDQDYFEVEKLFSQEWRKSLSNLTFDYVLGIVKNIVPGGTQLSNPTQINNFVNNFISTTKPELLLYLITELSGLPKNYYLKSLDRWNNNNYSNFEVFAPYASFVLRIELFFYICMLKGFESKQRPSHKIDLAYLFYLPFCNVFVSNDKLHKRVAPFFLRSDQILVDGENLKKGLAQLNVYYEQYSSQITEKGLLSFASQPPQDLENEVSKIWDQVFPNWRKSKSNNGVDRNLDKDKKLLEHLKKVQKESITTSRNTPMDKVHHIMTTHRVPVNKGKWRILPKGIEDKITTE
ncbi:hypothetical protein KKC08_02605 [Patescibacteria group bacterium]|nr:hypothetical protein [Patescibacteria group bacterium]MBU4578528.1 hypothetical protein [Patescibacteria group bacterium]